MKKTKILFVMAAVLLLIGAGIPIKETANDLVDGYYGDVPENNYVTSTFEVESDETIKQIIVENFSFSEDANVVFEITHAQKTYITYTFGDELRSNGFDIKIYNGIIRISTQQKVENVSESFVLRIFTNLERTEIVSKDISYKIIENETTKATSSGQAYPDYEKRWDFNSIFGPGWKSPLRICNNVFWAPEGAIEIPAILGEDVYAMKSGTVITTGYAGGYGNIVIIEHYDGMISVYGHCDEILVKQNDEISEGDTIATTGITGNTKDPSLYIDILDNSESIFAYNEEMDFVVTIDYYLKKLK